MIRFDKVNKWYRPDVQVLNDITAEVNKGEVVVLCGPSGSGKTTLIRTINRLEPINSGTITVNGQETHAKTVNVNRLRRDIGFVFQQFNLFPHMSVMDNITLAPRKLRGMSRARPKKRHRRCLPAWAWKTRPDPIPASCPAGRANGSPLRGRSPWIRRSSCSTSQPRHSIRKWSGRCWPSSRASRTRASP